MIVAGEGNKNEILGPPPFGAPQSEAPPFGAAPSGPQPFGAPPFGPARAGNGQKAVWAKIGTCRGPPFKVPTLRPHSSAPLPDRPPPDRPKFRFFFPSPASIFILSSSLGGSFRGILVVFEASVPTVHVWAHSLSCETPAAFAKCQEQFLQLISPMPLP